MPSDSRIEPRTLKGFLDWLPEAAIPRERLIETAKAVYRSFGFDPIDTPALEYTEILLGKGGAESDKQLYRFQDHGGRDVALRFDLTVPLARFVAQHLPELGLPFKRYHVGPVWRGENTQRGRYREFLQCDFDTIGSESIVSDVETALVIHELCMRFGIEAFTIRLNNRKLLQGLLERLDLSARSADVLRVVDKLDKVGRGKVAEELVAIGAATATQAGELLDALAVEGEAEGVLASLGSLLARSERGTRGVHELGLLYTGLLAAGVPPSRARLDVTIARGLDYYTGSVFETVLDALPGIGSICSGGRYDDLASLYTKERLPGVGASLGLDRLLAALTELGLSEKRKTSAPIFLAFFDERRRDDYLALASRLRRAGFGVELYPEPKKLGVQLKYADRRGHSVALVVGENEWQAGRCQVKELASGTSRDVALGDLETALAAHR
jgi:histidyl-tRNA synthetase